VKWGKKEKEEREKGVKELLQAHVTTKTDSEPSVVAWIVGGLLCLVGFWPCSCIPCCVDSMQQVTHSCPSCKNFLGRYKGGL